MNVLKTVTALLVIVGCVRAATQVTRHAITWHFDKDYTTGTFVNGDPWVQEKVAGSGVVITSIDPAPQTGSRIKNGSMVNIMPSKGQGYDNAGGGYDAELNAVADPGSKLPLTVPANSSLVSTKGIEPADDRPSLEDASVLTVLPADVTPDADDFRPPYAGSDKALHWNTDDIQWDRLPGLAQPAGGNVPTLSAYETATERVWLLHEHTSLGRAIHPQNNMKEYGRDLSSTLQNAMLRSCLNDSRSARERLVIQLLQIGIDIYGCVANGMKYPANGGHNQGMKGPLLYAGWLLDDAGMLWYGDKSNFRAFQEDESTFYVSDREVRVTNAATWMPDARGCDPVPYDSTHIGMPEWGIRHVGFPYYDNAAWCAIYRNVTGGATVGHALAMGIMDLEDAWNWPAFFDYYKTRYYPLNVEGSDNFVADMWAAYGDRVEVVSPVYDRALETLRNWPHPAGPISVVALQQWIGSIEMDGFSCRFFDAAGIGAVPARPGAYFYQIGHQTDFAAGRILVID